MARPTSAAAPAASAAQSALARTGDRPDRRGTRASLTPLSALIPSARRRLPPMSPSAHPPVSTLVTRHLSGLAAELAEGRHRELLEPLSLLAPGGVPALAAPPVERAALARELAAANAASGHPRAAELAARLADPATAVVVTGQQTGLLGGPLLALVKAAAAARWAAALTAAGRPAVAVFWMATEDHDFAEVAEATVLAEEGPLTLALGADPQPLAPVGLRTLGVPVTAVLDELAARFPAEWFQAWIERLAL